MPDTLEFFGKAIDGFDRRVESIRDEHWILPTPCTEWDVRALVHHLVYECVWVPPLLEGKTIKEIGDRFEGDLLGQDPKQAWRAAAAAAREAFSRPGALDGTVHLSYGETATAHYAMELCTDLLIHSWDLARAIGDEEDLDDQLVDIVYKRIEPIKDDLQATGMFSQPVEVPDSADLQTKLLAMVGRRR